MIPWSIKHDVSKSLKTIWKVCLVYSSELVGWQVAELLQSDLGQTRDFLTPKQNKKMSVLVSDTDGSKGSNDSAVLYVASFSGKPGGHPSASTVSSLFQQPQWTGVNHTLGNTPSPFSWRPTQTPGMCMKSSTYTVGSLTPKLNKADWLFHNFTWAGSLGIPTLGS